MGKKNRRKNTELQDKKDKQFRQKRWSKNIKPQKIIDFSWGDAKPTPPKCFHSLNIDFLDNDRDRLALVCSMGDRYKGLGGDAVASLQAGAALEK